MFSTCLQNNMLSVILELYTKTQTLNTSNRPGGTYALLF